MDASFTLVEEQRGSGRAKLSCIGRGIEYRELELCRNDDNVWEVTADSYQHPELLGDRVIFLLSELLCTHPNFTGTPTELARCIDPDGTQGVTPKNVSRKVLQNTAELKKLGITAGVRRSNGKRLIDLCRADSADHAGVGTTDPIDPSAAGTACVAPCAPCGREGGSTSQRPPARRTTPADGPEGAQRRAAQRRPVGADAYPLG